MLNIQSICVTKFANRPTVYFFFWRKIQRQLATAICVCRSGKRCAMKNRDLSLDRCFRTSQITIEIDFDFHTIQLDFKMFIFGRLAVNDFTMFSLKMLNISIWFKIISSKATHQQKIISSLTIRKSLTYERTFVMALQIATSLWKFDRLNGRHYKSGIRLR